jgi:hypothetical protein
LNTRDDLMRMAHLPSRERIQQSKNPATRRRRFR